MMSMQNLRSRMEKLAYPGNQSFDIDTLEPFPGETKERIASMHRNCPEIFEKHKSLLDIGSNKGFVCFHLRNNFDTITGYEVAKEYHELSKDINEYHGMDHIEFVNGGMREVVFDKHGFEKLPLGGYPQYEVIYCGSVHHHFFKDALLYGGDPFLWTRKLIGLATKYIILDGPFTMDDPSLKVFAKEGKWSDDKKKLYTYENIINNFKPYFKVIRSLANERRRHTVVLERCAENIRYIDANGLKEHLIKNAVEIQANVSRGPNVMFRDGNKRYKYDRGIQPDGVIVVLNYLSNYFPHIHGVLIENDKRVGDVMEWIDGDIVPENDEDKLFNAWRNLNNSIAPVGLFEPHYKHLDYKLKNAHYVDVDLDMIHHYWSFCRNTGYIGRWKTAIRLKTPKYSNTIISMLENISNKGVFHEFF